MAVAVRGVATAEVDGLSDFDVGSASAAANDLVLVGLGIRGNSTVTPPAGFTLLKKETGLGSTSDEYVYYKIATGSEPATYEFTTGSGEDGVIWCITLSGVDVVAPINVWSSQANTTASTTVVAAGVTPTVSNTMLVMIASLGGAGTMTAPTGFTEQLEAAKATSYQITDSVNTKLHTSGATGNVSASASQSRTSIGMLLAVAPSAGPGPQTVTSTGPLLRLVNLRTPTVARTGPQTVTLTGILNRLVTLYAPSVNDGSTPTQASWRSSSALEVDGLTDWQVPAPAGVANNDLVIVTLSIRGNSSVTAPVGEGFTLLFKETGLGSSSDLYCYWKIADASEPATYDFTTGSEEDGVITASAFQDVDTAAAINVWAKQANLAQSTSIAFPSVTPTTTDTLLVGIAHSPRNTTITEPAGWTEVVENRKTSSYQIVESHNTLHHPTATPTGVAAATQTASSPSIGAVLAIAGGVSLDQTVTATILTALVTPNAPTLTTGNTNRAVPLLANLVTLHTPTLQNAGVTLGPIQKMDRQPVFYAPTITTGNTNITIAALLTSLVTLHTPTVTPGNTNVTTPTFNLNFTVYEPDQITVAGINLLVATRLNQPVTLNAPTVGVGNVNVTVPHLSRPVTVYQPASVIVPGLAQTITVPTFLSIDVNLIIPVVSQAPVPAPQPGVVAAKHLTADRNELLRTRTRAG